MEINRQLIVKNFASWIVASIVAAALVWGAMTYKDADHNSKPCKERACFLLLDKRIAVIEAQMLARTQDRYTGTDARRDHQAGEQRRIQDRLLTQKEIASVRTEMNKRIDALHKR